MSETRMKFKITYCNGNFEQINLTDKEYNSFCSCLQRTWWQLVRYKDSKVVYNKWFNIQDIRSLELIIPHDRSTGKNIVNHFKPNSASLIPNVNMVSGLSNSIESPSSVAMNIDQSIRAGLHAQANGLADETKRFFG